MKKQYFTTSSLISIGVIGSRLSEATVRMLQPAVPAGVRVQHISDKQLPWSSKQYAITVLTDFDQEAAGNAYPHWTYYLNDYRIYVATRDRHVSLVANDSDPNIATMLREASCRVHKVVPIPRLVEVPLAMTMAAIGVVLTLPRPSRGDMLPQRALQKSA